MVILKATFVKDLYFWKRGMFTGYTTYLVCLKGPENAPIGYMIKQFSKQECCHICKMMKVSMNTYSLGLTSWRLLGLVWILSPLITLVFLLKLLPLLKCLRICTTAKQVFWYTFGLGLIINRGSKGVSQCSRNLPQMQRRAMVPEFVWSGRQENADIS